MPLLYQSLNVTHKPNIRNKENAAPNSYRNAHYVSGRWRTAVVVYIQIIALRPIFWIIYLPGMAKRKHWLQHCIHIGLDLRSLTADWRRQNNDLNRIFVFSATVIHAKYYDIQQVINITIFVVELCIWNQAFCNRTMYLIEKWREFQRLPWSLKFIFVYKISVKMFWRLYNQQFQTANVAENTFSILKKEI